MSMIETLVVRLEADTERLRRELARADSAVAASAKKIEQSTDRAAKAFAPLERAAALANRALIGLGAGLSARALVGFVKGAVDAVGGLGELAEQLGVSTKNLQVYQAAAVSVGVKTEEMRSAFQRFARSISEANEGNDGALKTFNALGVGVQDMSGKLRGTEAILADVADALAKIEDPATRAARAQELFGRGGQQLIPLLMRGSAGLREVQAELERLGLLFGDETIAKADKFSDRIAEMTHRWGLLADKWALDLLPVGERLLALLEKMSGLGPQASLEDRIAGIEASRRKYGGLFSGVDALVTGKAPQSLEALYAQLAEANARARIDPAVAMPVGRTKNPEGEGARKKRIDDEKRATEAYLDVLDRVEKQVGANLEKERKRVEAGVEFVEGMERENAVLELRLRGQEDLADLLEAEARLKKIIGEDDLTPELTERLRKLVTEQNRLNKAIEAQEEASKKAQRAAEEAQREIQRRIEVASDRIVDFAGDSLFDALTGKAKNFWESFKEFGLRAFAQLAAEAIIRPIITPIVSGIVGGAFGGGASGGGLLGGIGQSIGGSVLSNALGLPSIGSSIGNALNLGALFGGGGLAAATSAASAAGGSGLAAWAAAEGTLAAGSTAGLFGGGGLLGLGAVGGPLALGALALGGLAASGMFGKESKRGMTAGAGFNIGADGRFFYQLSADNGGNAESLRGEAETALALLNQISAATGVMPTQAQLQKAVRPIRVGTGDAFNTNIVSFEKGGFRGATDLVRDLVGAGLFGNPEDPKIKTISEKGAGAVEQAQAVQSSIARAILAITDPMAAALENLADEHKARLDAVSSIGGDIVAAERLYGLQRQQVIEQYQEQELAKLESTKGEIVNFFASILGPLTSFRSTISVGPNSALSPGAQLSFARGEFDTLFNSAQAGNRAAIDAFPTVAQQFLGASRAVNATGPGYAADFTLTNQRLNQVIGQVQALQGDNFQNLAATFELSIQDQTAQLVKRLDTLTAAVNKLKAAA